MERSIEKLVALAKQEDQDAINELYNRTFKKAYFVARASIKSSDGDYTSQIEDEIDLTGREESERETINC